MNVLLISGTFFPRKFGGQTLFSYNLAKSLLRKGYEVTVYTTDVNDKNSRHSGVRGVKDVEGIKVHYFRNLNNPLAYNNWYLPIGMISTMKKEINNFDVIHLISFRSLLSIIVHHYSLKKRIPYLLEVQGGVQPIGKKQTLRKFFDALFGYRILRDASRVIAGCETEINECKDMGVKQAKIVLIPPLYDIEAFSRLPPSGQFKRKFDIKEKHIILFLARMHKIKGIKFLVESFNQLNLERDDVILVLAGPDQGYKSTLEGLIKKLNLSRKILFTGILQGEEKLSALADADMLVQTSIYERGPGSPFEAILCDTPIIVTNNTGAGEIVSKIDAGYLVEYGDINELKNLMNRILDDPTEANIKTQRAKEYIINNLSWQEGVKQYERVYREVMNNNQHESLIHNK
ncbi:glycosyltransferase family 4 protein [Dehalococcoidia bacterium]|nr:glycosyltransferase family 4 protein [Dehalococcoidia bacterium]